MSLAKKENFKTTDPLWAIIISVVMASVVMVYPLPYESSAWRPMFMLLVTFFWIMCQPAWCGVWFSFAMGLFTDLLMEMPLGVNAICFVLIMFVVRYLTRDKRVMTESNLWIIFSIVMLVYLISVWLMLVMAGKDILIIRHLQPLLPSIVVWPLVYWGLKKWRAV